VRILDPKLMRVASAGLGFGAVVAVTSLLGYWAGGAIDRWLDTSPVFAALLVLLAIVGSFIEFIRQIRSKP
jgi:hypothetical protein